MKNAAIKRFVNFHVAPPAAYALIRGIGATLSVTLTGHDPRQTPPGAAEPNIYVFWHGQLFLYPALFRGRSDFAILASPSADGEIIARTLQKFGFTVVRGSSFKNARTALREMVRQMEAGRHVVIIGDGSRGPYQKLQPGAVMLAKLTGRPVRAAATAFSRQWTLGSWDRLAIPKPFARAVVVSAEPVSVPSDADDAALERIRADIESSLHDLTRRAEELARS